MYAMWDMGWGYWWIFPMFMMLVMVAFCAFLMMRMFGGHTSGRVDNASALRILNERFARGEIQKEEFEDKRAVLQRRP